MTKLSRRAFQELQVNPRSAGTMGDLAVYYAKKAMRATPCSTFQQRVDQPEISS